MSRVMNVILCCPLFTGKYGVKHGEEQWNTKGG